MILLLADFLFVYLFPKYTTDGPYAIKKKMDQILLTLAFRSFNAGCWKVKLFTLLEI